MLEPFRDLFRRLIQWASRPAQPGAMYVFCEEFSMANLFRVRVLLPPVNGPDVAKRKLLRTMNDDPDTTVELGITTSEHETTFKARQDDRVRLELRQVDDVGNVSEPSILDFTVIDTTPPAAPAEMSVTLEELPDEDPAPVPTPDPEPTPDEPAPL